MDGMSDNLDLIKLDVEDPVWDHFFTVAPLVVVGTKGKTEYDLAPKHLAMPMSWDNYYGFVCTPSHQTYKNVESNREFSVSFVNPDQVVLTSLTASPRCEDESHSKPIVEAIETLKAEKIDALFMKDSYLFLECKLHSVIDDFGKNSLIVGEIVNAQVDRRHMRRSDFDEERIIHEHPLLAYVSPGRFASLKETNAFPFPKDFKR